GPIHRTETRVSPDERSLVAWIDAARRRARVLAIAEAAACGVAVAAISTIAGAIVAACVAALRLQRTSRTAVVDALERASADARNLFVTADELDRGGLSAAARVRER